MKISFLKRAEGTSGDSYEATIMSFDLPDSLPPSDAVARAVELFEKAAGVSHWQQAAERYVVA